MPQENIIKELDVLFTKYPHYAYIYEHKGEDEEADEIVWIDVEGFNIGWIYFSYTPEETKQRIKEQIYCEFEQPFDTVTREIEPATKYNGEIARVKGENSWGNMIALFSKTEINLI